MKADFSQQKKKKHASTNFESFSYVVFVPSDFPN